jgi:hypothetical protein
MPPLTIKDALWVDFATALSVSANSLAQAAERALELLILTGHAGSGGDTADDLRIALATHLHLVHELKAKANTEAEPGPTKKHRFTKPARDATPTAKPDSEPDLLVIAAAHRALKVAMPLSQALSNPAIKVVLHAVATKARKRQPRIDFRKLAANDLD